MILTFSEYGRGKGKGPVRYVCESTKPDGSQRSVAPRILCGDPAIVRRLIDNNENKWKYTSAVLSFTKEEYTPELAKEILDEFIETAYPGLEPHQYELLAVLHMDTANPHIHIIAPRVELTTGKDLNIAPPHTTIYRPAKDDKPAFAGLWPAWATLTRAKHGLGTVDPRELDASPFTKKERRALKKIDIEKLPHAQAKQKIHNFIVENIANGLCQERGDIVKLLRSQGFEVNKLTETGLSVVHAGKNIRLQKGIYERRIGTTYAEIISVAENDKQQDRGIDAGEFKRLEERYKISLGKIHQRNIEEYGEGKSKSRAEHKAFFLSLKKTTSNLRSNFNASQSSERRNKSNDIAQGKRHSPKLQTGIVSNTNTTEKIKDLVSRLYQTTDPMERAELNAQIYSLSSRSIPKL